MLFHFIMFELFKLKRQKIWPLVIIIPFVSVFLGYANFLANYNVLVNKAADNAWLEAWTQVTLFMG